jgi:oligoendopeptidase F
MENVIKISKILEEKDVRYGQLEWTQYTTGYDFGVDDAYKELTDVYENKAYFDTIKQAMASDLSEEDRRRVSLIYKAFEPYHLSEKVNELAEKINEKTNELSQILNQHRTIFEGKEVSSVDLAQILAKEENRERRKAAFFAKNQINKPLIEAGFLDLVAMRKELARLRGKQDFVELMLEEDELDASIFENWKNEVRDILPKMKETRLKYAQKFLNDTEIMPWDESYISAKLAPALNEKVDMSAFYDTLKEFFIKFDIDLSKMNITYDVFSRANKSEWGYNFPIQSGKDSRILANVKDLYSEYGVLLHESGHAVHSFTTDPEDYLMSMGISGIISEGIANLFGGFLYDELFYSQFFKKEAVAENFKEIQEWHKINSFRAIHRILLDQAFYRTELNSMADIESLYWNLYETLFDEKPYGENPPWAYLIHHTTHPIYLHNYFMGDVTCEMLAKVFKEKHGIEKVSEKPVEFGQFLMEKVITPSG